MLKPLKDQRAQLFRGLYAPLATYINRGKLFASADFLDMVNLTTKAALTASNYAYACQLVKFFDETPFQTNLVKWLETRANLEVQITTAKVKIHKRATGAHCMVKLAEYFTEAQRASNERAMQTRIQELESQGKIVSESTGVDLMNIGRRLPGSFEHGNRC